MGKIGYLAIHFDPNKQGKNDCEAVQQLERFVLFCKRPNVEDKDRISLPHVEG